ncbi:MAG: hypothetical protein ABI398_09795 [Devosia sp.]
MAKANDQFQAKDVTFWGVLALVLWGVAVTSAGLSALVPDSVLAGLHASRLAGADLNQLRSEMATLSRQSTELRQENTVLLQRFMLTEQTGGDMTRRVGALELTLPRILESLNNGGGIDRGAITASTGANQVTSFDADGGSVSYTRSPLPGDTTPAAAQKIQPMPRALNPGATPDAASFGIALGPPIDENEADDAWQSMNTKVGTLLVGLGPILGHVEGGAGRRLVAGPIASEADAREICGRMARIGIACASVPFIGDPLPLLN